VLQRWDDEASWDEARANEQWSTPGCADRSECREDPELMRPDLPLGEVQLELPAELVQEWIDRQCAPCIPFAHLRSNRIGSGGVFGSVSSPGFVR
jgi:hypothetical protein